MVASVRCLHFNHSGQMVTGAEDGEIIVWSRLDGRVIKFRFVRVASS